MRDLLDVWRKTYDWILFDTPPLLFVSDASILSTLADGVVIVVRAGATTRALLTRTREQLENVNARVVGSILNGMIVSRVGRHYSYYGYYGYSQYAKDYHRTYYGDTGEDDVEDSGAEPSRGSSRGHRRRRRSLEEDAAMRGWPNALRSAWVERRGQAASWVRNRLGSGRSHRKGGAE